MGSIDEEAWDLYREVHKAARLVLFRAVMTAGCADAASDLEVEGVRVAVDDVLFVLRSHHHHERDFVDELVARHADGLRSEVDAAHQVSDDTLDAIEALLGEMTGAPVSERNPVLHRLYLDLAAFTATYLQHLDMEERRVMPALNAAMTRGELMELTERLRSSIGPADMCRFMQSMLPSMNIAERADMLGGMSHAPAEIWDLLRGAAVQALPADQYEAVEQRIAAH